jgi:putative hydrolase
MSNFGFGFGQPDDPNSRPGGDLGDLAGKMPLFAELQRLLAGSGGPVNWDLARQLAISNLAGAHHVVTPADAEQASDALRLADLWLDDVTDLPSGIGTTQAWSQVEWVEKTVQTWSALCDPVAARVVTAMSGALPPDVAEQAGPLGPMMSQLGGLMFGAQLGQGLAALAGEVVSATDVGLPLGPSGVGALVPSNLNEFARGLDHPAGDVRLFLALREAAHQRLYGHIPWLRQAVLDAVDAYGRGIVIDPAALSGAMAEIDPANPESLQRALAGGLFQPETSQAQTLALRRLETLLALVEGWVDHTVSNAARSRMSTSDALGEALRRRRATGGPAEQTFETLVGLTLRPRRLREAAELWSAMTAQHGGSVRDQLWNHPDLLPSADDLDDPSAFAAHYGRTADLDMTAFESALRELDSDASATGREQPDPRPGQPSADTGPTSSSNPSTSNPSTGTPPGAPSESTPSAGSGPGDSPDDDPAS